MFALTLILLLFIGYLVKSRRFWWFYFKHPRLWSLPPPIGTLYNFWRVSHEDMYTVLKNIEEPQKISRSCWVGHMFWLVVKKPEEIQIILNSEETFDKPDHGLNVLVEHGLLNEGGEKYKLQRKTINPFFVPSNLKKFFPVINKKMSEFLDRFDARIPSGEFDITSQIMDFTLDTIFNTMFNIPHVAEEKRLQLLENLDEFILVASMKIFKIWLNIDFIFKRSQYYTRWVKHRGMVFKFIEELVEENEQNFQNGNEQVKSISFIDYLYKIRQTLSYEETLEDVFVLLASSFETTGSVLPHILLLLAMNQEHQENCFQEISQILLSPEDEVTEEMWNEMKYLERCIKESLRLIPAAVILARKVKKDLKLVDYIVPSGTHVIVYTHLLHTEKNIRSDDALKFNPDRFLDENFKKIHPYAYLPFSNGPRICPGHKYAWIVMKIFLSRFLLKYRVTTTLKYEDLKLKMRITTSINQGALMQVERR